MFCSCRISTDKRVARSLCNSRASCSRCRHLDFQICEILLRMVSGGPRSIIMLNVIILGLSVAEILQFFEFLRWPPPPSLIVEITKFYWLTESRGLRHISVPNFVKIGCEGIKIFPFLPRDAMLSTVYAVVVCLCVCVCVCYTPVLYQNG